MTAETMPRAEWLRLEIGYARDYIDRHQDDDDPIAQAQVVRRQREMVAHHLELAAIKAPPMTWLGHPCSCPCHHRKAP